MDARINRSKRAVLAVLAAAAVALALVPAQPAFAATSPCGLWPWATWVDGAWVYGGATFDCTGTGRMTDLVNSKLQEEYGFIVHTRDDDSNSVQTTGQLAVRTEYYCAGHGTDNWRSTAYGRDTNGATKGTYYGSWASRTC